MKLTDLNIDCLESILEYLEFGDVLSAASSNKRLEKAANFIFMRKHYRKRVSFKYICFSRDRLFKIDNYSIYIRDLKTSLQFMRCFGHLISNIHLKQRQSHLNQHVINYLNEYCSDSIEDIRIENGLKGWEYLQKPFSKVKRVYLEKCHATVKDSIDKLYPKIQLLDCRYCSHRTLLSGISNHFSNLEMLNILDSDTRETISCGDSLAPVLHLNPQLKYLYIDTDNALLDSRDFQNAIKTLQKLETLAFRVKTLTSKSIDSRIHLKNVKDFTIYICSNDITKIPFSFGLLENLTIQFSHKLNAAFFSFIDKHPTIKDLTLFVSNLSVKDQTKIAKSLPLLDKISLICKISTNEAAYLMSKFGTLKNFSFDINEITAYDDFRSQLNNDWECKINDNGWVSVIRCSPRAKKRKIN